MLICIWNWNEELEQNSKLQSKVHKLCEWCKQQANTKNHNYKFTLWFPCRNGKILSGFDKNELKHRQSVLGSWLKPMTITLLNRLLLLYNFALIKDLFLIERLGEIQSKRAHLWYKFQ